MEKLHISYPHFKNKKTYSEWSVLELRHINDASQTKKLSQSTCNRPKCQKEFQTQIRSDELTLISASYKTNWYKRLSETKNKSVCQELPIWKTSQKYLSWKEEMWVSIWRREDEKMIKTLPSLHRNQQLCPVSCLSLPPLTLSLHLDSHSSTYTRIPAPGLTFVPTGIHSKVPEGYLSFWTSFTLTKLPSACAPARTKQ